MKRLLLASAITALMLSNAAYADPHGHGGGKGHEHQTFAAEHGMHDGDRRDGDRNEHRDRRDDERYEHREHHDRRMDSDRGPEWRREGRHDNGLHLGQRKHAWARGQRISRVYLAPRYYVTDYSQYRLAAPPQGMVWVRPYQNDRRFYLVQVATGLISQILGR